MDCAWLLAYYFISNQVNMRSKFVLNPHLGDITQLYVTQGSQETPLSTA